MRVKPKKTPAKAVTKPAEPLYEQENDEDEPVEFEYDDSDDIKPQPKSRKPKTKVNSNVEGLENDKQCARRLPYDAKKVRRVGNKFKDTGTIAKADKKIDKLLFQEPLVERSRKSSVVKATCIICHRTHSVDKSLIHNGKYRCNNCCMGAS